MEGSPDLRRRSSPVRGDVLVHVEEVGRVVPAFDGRQTFPCGSGVRLANSKRTFVAKEVDVGAMIPLTECHLEIGDPRRT